MTITTMKPESIGVPLYNRKKLEWTLNVRIYSFSIPETFEIIVNFHRVVLHNRRLKFFEITEAVNI